jgi:hypothetical protein
MRNFNETTITGAVLDRIKDDGPPRIKEMSEARVRHRHAFMREVCPTQKEWERRVLNTPYYRLNYDFGLKPLASEARAA